MRAFKIHDRVVLTANLSYDVFDIHILLCKIIMHKLNYERAASYSWTNSIKNMPVLKQFLPTIMNSFTSISLLSITEMMSYLFSTDVHDLFT